MPGAVRQQARARREAANGRPRTLTAGGVPTKVAAMFTFGIADSSADAFDPMVLLLGALLIEAYVGDLGIVFRVLTHPVAVIGSIVGALEKKLNREKRSPADRAVRGLFLVLFMVAATGAVGWGVQWLTRHHTFGWILEFVLLVTLLAQRSLYDHVRAVARGLRDSLEAGRSAVSHIVGRDPGKLDAHGVARAAIESLAENFGDGVVAPVFWYVLFGFPGLLIYKTVNTMDSMIGHRNERYRAFGMVAARLDDALNFFPARLSGLMIALGALVAPGANPFRAARTMLRDAGKHRSFNAGWPEGAMAGALGLALAGPRRYAEYTVNDPWIGDGTAQATAAHIDRALYLYVVACLIDALMVAAVTLARFAI